MYTSHSLCNCEWHFFFTFFYGCRHRQKCDIRNVEKIKVNLHFLNRCKITVTLMNIRRWYIPLIKIFKRATGSFWCSFQEIVLCTFFGILFESLLVGMWRWEEKIFIEHLDSLKKILNIRGLRPETFLTYKC